MLVKILILILTLVFFLLVGYTLLRKRIQPYHALTWGLVEGFWYAVSFLALCGGLVELERIERLNEFKNKEKILNEDYSNKKSLLYAQSWILKLDHELPENQKEGVLWFHKMRSYFEEDMNGGRWESFLIFSKSYIKNDRHSDFGGKALEFGWPLNLKSSADSLYLKDDIIWMQDTLQNFLLRREAVQRFRPEENTNFQMRYALITMFLIALALKFIKIYADYIRNRTTH